MVRNKITNLLIYVLDAIAYDKKTRETVFFYNYIKRLNMRLIIILNSLILWMRKKKMT